MADNKSYKDSSDCTSQVAKNFSYTFRLDEAEINSIKQSIHDLEEEDVFVSRRRIEDIQKRQNLIRQLIEIAPPANAQLLNACQERDLGKIKLNQRWMMYSAWRLKAIESLQEKSVQIEEEFQQTKNRLQDIRDLESAGICKNSSVVGFTTTGAAKQRALLNHLKPKIGMLILER